MKVKNVRNIMFAKGLELEKDLQPGDVGMVKMGYEQSERIVHAVQSGALQTLPDTTQVGDSVIHTPTPDDGFTRLVGSVHIGPQDAKNATVKNTAVTNKGESMSPDPGDVASNEYAEQQLAEFKRLRGHAKVKFAGQLTDTRVVREALSITKKGKTKQALEARLEELLPKSIDLEAIPNEGDEQKGPETFE